MADPSGSAVEVSAERKLHFATARSAIEHARNRILHCSVEVAMDTVDFDCSSCKVGKNLCNLTQFDEWVLI